VRWAFAACVDALVSIDDSFSSYQLFVSSSWLVPGDVNSFVLLPS